MTTMTSEDVRFLHDAGSVLYLPELSSGIIRHRGSTLRAHCLRTAWLTFKLCRFFHLSPEHEREAVRAALVHDLSGNLPYKGMHLTFAHGHVAAERMRFRAGLGQRGADAVAAHMFPFSGRVPKSSEAWLLTFSDKLVALCEYLFCRRLGEPHAEALTRAV